jgi:hypothetical protein
MLKLKNRAEAIVAQIHSEFDNAQDRLLQEAKNLIAGNDTSREKGLELIEVGFINSKPAQRYLAKHTLLVEGLEQARVIEYYKEKYPFQKFITEAELNRICTKYNLIYAPVANYTEDVPDKNIRDIKNVQPLSAIDAPENIKKCKLKLEGFFMPNTSFLSFWSKWYRRLPRVIDGHYQTTWHVDRLLNEKYETGITWLVDSIKNIELNRQGLFIAAPKSHFNLKGLAKEGLAKEGLLHSSFTITEIKDPIVFRFVKGGVQIITKWGLEAADVVNDIEN